MNKYIIRIVGQYTQHIFADGMKANPTGDYQFWNFKQNSNETYTIAHYPICHTIIENIEYDTRDNK